MRHGKLSDDQPVRRPNELVRAALEGDQRAYRSLYDAHVERVFRLAYRMVGGEEAAREATQKVFIRAFNSLGQFRGDAQFSTWLHRVAVSVILNERQSVRRRRDREVVLDEQLAGGGANRPEPDVMVRLGRAVEGLAEIYRTVFVMHDVEGFKHEEIADCLGVAVGTSKARLSRARAMLRQALGGEPSKAT